MIENTTPMMRQWHACKDAAPNAVLFFRMGDFYEAFHDDAVVISRELDLTLTKRQGTPMCGVPVHTYEGHVDRLVAKGHRVAVAEQMEDPRAVKGLVKREVVRVVTPGTVIDSSLISDKANNFIVAVSRIGQQYGLSCLDLSTADFTVIELSTVSELHDELHRLHPAEIVTSNRFHQKELALFQDLKAGHNYLLSTLEDWRFDHQVTHDLLIEHFHVHSLDGFGLHGMTAGITTSGALLYYLRDKLSQPLDHIQTIAAYSNSQYMAIDRMTQRNLELVRSLHDGSRRNTLLDTLDRTNTPMGGRLLRHWICQPLLDASAIRCRQEAVASFLQNSDVFQGVSGLLSHVRDIERLIMKVSANYASPRDLVALRLSLEALPPLKQHLSSLNSPSLSAIKEQIEDLSETATLIATMLVDEPPIRLSDNGVIRDGFHSELDELRTIQRDGKAWITSYQQRLRDELDIKTLKIGFNKVFGYYIEVSRGQSSRMPDTFQRRQTLANNERFLSSELKEFEQKVLTAEDRVSGIEQELFQSLRRQIATASEAVLRSARAIAQIDCLLGFSMLARENGYIRPVIDESTTITIEEGRHPVLDACSTTDQFIPNNTHLDSKKERLHLITGPNMAGKSTYIRQVALLSLMAQIGSYIPARSARIGIIDKLFTRIGASDDLTRGHSTFMVEMTETANILNNATDRSLIVLDEIGRGTSTYDGISIAWAVAEHLLTTPGKQSRTLFATHYFELIQLEKALEGAVNYNVAVKELDDSIVFLRKIVRGSADRSYGIHVGRLAGLPSAVVRRAEQLLVDLEALGKAGRKAQITPKRRRRSITTKGDTPLQLSLFESA